MFMLWYWCCSNCLTMKAEIKHNDVRCYKAKSRVQRLGCFGKCVHHFDWFKACFVMICGFIDSFLKFQMWFCFSFWGSRCRRAGLWCLLLEFSPLWRKRYWSFLSLCFILCLCSNSICILFYGSIYRKRKPGFACVYGESEICGEMCLEFVGLVRSMSIWLKSWFQNSLGACVTYQYNAWFQSDLIFCVN